MKKMDEFNQQNDSNIVASATPTAGGSYGYFGSAHSYLLEGFDVEVGDCRASSVVPPGMTAPMRPDGIDEGGYSNPTLNSNKP